MEVKPGMGLDQHLLHAHFYLSLRVPEPRNWEVLALRQAPQRRSWQGITAVVRQVPPVSSTAQAGKLQRLKDGCSLPRAGPGRGAYWLVTARFGVRTAAQGPGPNLFQECGIPEGCPAGSVCVGGGGQQGCDQELTQACGKGTGQAEPHRLV